MAVAEYDVFVSFSEPAGSEVARKVEAALTRRGFRVYLGGVGAGAEATDRAFGVIEQAPDFVMLVTPDASDAYGDERLALGRQLAHAVRCERNVIPVYMPGCPAPAEGGTPVAGVETYQAVTYAPHIGEQSVARIAHRLTSDVTVEDRKMSRQAKWWLGAVAIALLVVAAGVLSGVLNRFRPPPPLPPIAVALSAFGQRMDNGRVTEFIVEDGTIVRGGDQIRLMFTPSSDGHAYVLGQDARGDVSVLFPLRAVKGNSRVKAGEVYRAPADRDWSTIDPPAGLQALFVVVSYDSIENFESLIDERDGDSTVQQRSATLQSTIAGLLDGKRAVSDTPARTRRDQAIVRTLEAPPMPPTVSMTLEDGTVVTRPLRAHTGLVSVVAEFKFKQGR